MNGPTLVTENGKKVAAIENIPKYNKLAGLLIATTISIAIASCSVVLINYFKPDQQTASAGLPAGVECSTGSCTQTIAPNVSMEVKHPTRAVDRVFLNEDAADTNSRRDAVRSWNETTDNIANSRRDMNRFWNDYQASLRNRQPPPFKRERHWQTIHEEETLPTQSIPFGCPPSLGNACKPPSSSYSN